MEKNTFAGQWKSSVFLHMVKVNVPYGERAAIRLFLAQKQLHHSRFTRARISDDKHKLAVLYPQVQSVKHTLSLLIGLYYVLKLYHNQCPP